uniref:Beta-lactamase domain-containing protein n=1 Tax=Heterorhabditis bacteriophora TaxID=37862 RepID=A0A1I7W7G6_HETBA
MMWNVVVKSVFLVLLLAYCIQLYFYNSTIDPHIEGNISDERFKLVYEVFRSNFIDGWEREGASLVVYQKGKKVVDIWGGYADKESGRLWQRDTLNIAFSCTKAVAGICIAKLVDQGLLNYDDPVEKHWPGFGKNGKENITVRWLLGHRAGLAYTDHKIHLHIANDSKAISRVFEEQRPNWPPGTEIGYHALTFGWLVDQLIRRVDPKGRSIGVYFKQDIADKYSIFSLLKFCDSCEYYSYIPSYVLVAECISNTLCIHPRTWLYGSPHCSKCA